MVPLCGLEAAHYRAFFMFSYYYVNHNNCRLLCLLPVTLKVIAANSVDPDQTPPPLGAVWSGSTLFAYMQNVSLKSLQEDAADDISRRHFQMQIFLALHRLSGLSRVEITLLGKRELIALLFFVFFFLACLLSITVCFCSSPWCHW